MARRSKKKNLLDLLRETPTELENELIRVLLEPVLEPRTAWMKTLLKELSETENNACLNAHELIFMYKSLEEVDRNLDQLKVNVETQLLRTKKLCPNHKINFNESLFANLFNHFNCDKDRLFPLIKKLEYDSTVEHSLYPPHILERVKGIEGYDIYSVRLKKDNMIECLVCNFKVSQTKIDKLWDHVRTISHIRRLDLHYANLTEYHEFWMMQNPSKQEIQVMYQYFNDSTMKCIKCWKRIPYDDVLEHQCAPRNSREKRVNENIEQPRRELDYSKEVKSTLYQGLPHLDIDGIQYPLMQRDKDSVLCLICNVEVTEGINVHCDSDSHALYQSYFTCTETLKEYHCAWSSLPGFKQMQQIHFRRHHHGMTCVLCNYYIPYDGSMVDQHIKLTKHVTNLRFIREVNEKHLKQQSSQKTEEDMYQASSNQTVAKVVGSAVSKEINSKENTLEARNSDKSIKQSPKEVGYCKEVKNALYLEVPHINIDDIQYPFMQRHEDLVLCMVCNVEVTDAIKVHCDSNSHIELQNYPACAQTLKEYHCAWSSLSGDKQVQQVYFQRRQFGTICTLCNYYIPYDAAMIDEHLKLAKHVKNLNVRTEQKEKSKVKVSDQKENEGNCLKKLSDDESSFQMLGQMFFDVTPKKANFREENLKEVKDLNYTADIKRSFFHGLPHLEIDGTRYPVMHRVLGITVCCIICDELVLTPVNMHEADTNHIEKLRNKFHQYVLSQYHNIFSALPSTKQQQLIFFQKLSWNIVCSLCKVSMPYNISAVKEHIYSSEHECSVAKAKNDMLALDITEFNFEEDDNTKINKLIEVTDTVISNDISNENIPTHVDQGKENEVGEANEEQEDVLCIDYTRSVFKELYDGLPGVEINGKSYPLLQRKAEDTIHCLLCAENVNQSIDEHLNTTNHRQRAADQDHMRSLQNYHSVWRRLPADTHIEQIYHKRLKDKMICILCNFPVMYKKSAVRLHLGSKRHKAHIKNIAILEQQIVEGSALAYLADQVPNLDTLIYLMDTGIEKFNGKLRSNIIEDIKNCTSDHPNDLETMLQSLYGSLPRIDIDGKLYPVLQRINDKIRCLLCNYYIILSPSIHIKLIHHLREEKRHISTLKKYHDIWSALSAELQMQQLHFKRLGTFLECSICSRSLCYDVNAVKKHTQSQSHRKNLTAQILMENEGGHTGISGPITRSVTARSLIFDNIIGYHMRSVSDLDTSIYLMDTIVQKNRVQISTSEDHLKQQPDLDTLIYLIDTEIQKLKSDSCCTNDYMKNIQEVDVDIEYHLRSVSNLDASIYLMDTSIKKFGEHITDDKLTGHNIAALEKDKLQQNSSNKIDEIVIGESLPYAPAAVKKLFYGLPYTYFNGFSYPIMQHVQSAVFCQICRKKIEEPPMYHMELRNHRQRMATPKWHSKLILYHDVWSSLPGFMQYHQVHFRIKVKQMSCTICGVKVPYDATALKKHLHTSKHRDKYAKWQKSTKPLSQKHIKDDKVYNFNSEEVKLNSSRKIDVCSATSSSNNNYGCIICEEERSKIVLNGIDGKYQACASSSELESFSDAPSSSSSSNCEQLECDDIIHRENIEENVSNGISVIEGPSDDYLRTFTISKHEGDDLGNENERDYFKSQLGDIEVNQINGTVKDAKLHLEDIMNQTMPTTSKVSLSPSPNGAYPLKVPTIFPSYHASTSEVLYGNGLIHYNVILDDVKYPIIQNIGPYKHCLICAESLSSELFHCNSESHTNNLKSIQTHRLLRKYHNVFVQLPIKYQIQQKYFRKEKQLRCILCSVSVPYDSKLILEHVQLPQHISKQERFEASPNTSRDSSPIIKQEIEMPTKKSSPKKNKGNNNSKNNSPKNIKNEMKSENGISDLTDLVITEKCQKTSSSQSSKKGSPEQIPQPQKSLGYSSAAKEKLFKDLEEHTVAIHDKHYYIFRNSLLGVRCILCNDGPAANLSDHMKTSNHIKHMESERALATLEKYHVIWLADTKLQQQQFYIIQRHCHICHVTISESQMKQHVISEEHLKKVSDNNSEISNNKMQIKIYMSADPITKIRVINIVKEINGEVQSHVYVNCHINETPAPTAIPKKTQTGGLGSSTELLNDQSGGKSSELSEITELTLNYSLWLKDTVYYGLSQYTVTVDDVKYPYLRRTWKGLRCLLCEDATVIDIFEHIKDKSHVKSMQMPVVSERVKNFHKYWIKFNEIQQVYFTNQRCVLCSQYVGDGTQILEHIPDKCHRIYEDGYTREDLLDKLGIGGKFWYCEEAYMEFYEEVKEHYTYFGLVKLPLLRVTTEGKRCVLCDDAGVSSPNQHVGTLGHKQALHDSQKLEKLWKFHRMWQRMSVKAQMQQEHVIVMMCIVCDKKLNIDTAEAHLLSKTHEVNVKLKQQKPAKPVKTNKHDIKESAINPKSPHMIDQLPFYLSYHLKVLTSDPENHEQVTCTPCKKTFTKLYDLRHHLDSPPHCRISKVNRFKGNFFCEICLYQFSTDLLWIFHLTDEEHTKHIKKLGDSRKANMKEHFCHTCQMIIFGDAISLLRHAKTNKLEKELRLSLNKALKDLLSSRNHIIETTDELLKVAENEMEQSEMDVEECCLALENTLKTIYPDCRAYPFGSRMTGLGNNISDLDVFVDIGGVYDGSCFQSALHQADIVCEVGEMLKKQKKHFSDISLVPGARTPIVKVLHKDTDIECDISFRHGLSVENTAFIRFCIDLQPKMKPAMLFLKDWIAKCDLSYGTLTSYAFNLLFIFFLQQSNYLLSVVEIRKINNSKGPFIDGWEAIEYTVTPDKVRKHVKECTLSFPELLEKFFEYYSNFDFYGSVVCPLLGRTLHKSQFQPRRTNLPSEMITYVKKLNGPNPEHFRHRTAMCVQDPFDLSHNVTKGCSDTLVSTFQKYCRLSFSQISALK